ncbi:MAG TPA: S8 family serine peptidase [Methanotrichaceae archaeon]|nr:S8 family serine peptidase [Methanotrichaceae archaeon]
MRRSLSVVIFLVTLLVFTLPQADCLRVDYSTGSSAGTSHSSEQLEVSSSVGYVESAGIDLSGITRSMSACGVGDAAISDTVSGNDYSATGSFSGNGQISLGASSLATPGSGGICQDVDLAGTGSASISCVSGSQLASQASVVSSGTLISSQGLSASSGQVASSGSSSLQGDSVGLRSQIRNSLGRYSREDVQQNVESAINADHSSYASENLILSSWSRQGSGNILPISDVWTSADGTRQITNDIVGRGFIYNISGTSAIGSDFAAIAQHLGDVNGWLHSNQTVKSYTNGEFLNASNDLISAGSVEGDQVAIADASKAHIYQSLTATGALTELVNSSIGSDRSSAAVMMTNGDHVDVDTLADAWSNINDSTVYHRTEACLEAAGWASKAEASSLSIYSSKYASSMGRWVAPGFGDVSTKAETVRSATSDVEITNDSDMASAETSSGIIYGSGLARLSGLRADTSGDYVYKFQTHLYSHAYPKNEHHDIDEYVSTQSVGINGKGIQTDIYRWDAGSKGWSLNKSYYSPSEYTKVIRANDILTSNYTWKKLWELPARNVTPSASLPWGIKMMYNNSDLNHSSGGRWIDVAVVDSGIDAQHPDLVMRLEDYANGYPTFGPNTGPGELDQSDASGHGTHVSGTIAADGGFDGLGIWGMAPEANLRAFLGPKERGINRSTDLGAEIISMSWGVNGYLPRQETSIKNAINYAINYGVLPVAAAGNGIAYGARKESFSDIVFPARLPGVVAVGAVDEQGNAGWWVSPGYNNGSGVIDSKMVMFGAPGVWVYSTYPTYKSIFDPNDTARHYDNMNGTSMATPHISGLAAKIWSENLLYGWGAGQVKGLMQSIARKNDVTTVAVNPRATEFLKELLWAEYHYAKDPPGEYYSQLLPYVNGSQWVGPLPIRQGDDPLTGLGIPKLPEGSI